MLHHPYKLLSGLHTKFLVQAWHFLLLILGQNLLLIGGFLLLFDTEYVSFAIICLSAGCTILTWFYLIMQEL